MHIEAKKRITAAIDAHAKDGKTATLLRMHPATALELGIHGTHLDWNSATLHPHADAVVAELTHEKYDERIDTDPHVHPKTGEKRAAKPKTAEEAAAIAKERDHSGFRREVVLEVVLDPKVEPGKLLVGGVVTQTVEKEA